MGCESMDRMVVMTNMRKKKSSSETGSK